jgi:hypothetical protein
MLVIKEYIKKFRNIPWVFRNITKISGINAGFLGISLKICILGRYKDSIKKVVSIK